MSPNAIRWLWHALAAGLLLALGLGLHAAAKRIDYTWHWDRIPQYLVSTEGHAVQAPFDGFVALGANGRDITLTALRGSEVATLTEHAQVVVGDGDLVFEGDVIARTDDIVAGPLLLGLGLTLQISAASLIVSLVLGLVVGLARVSANPAARDLAGVYVEVIRGTPLLVQIFIIYFFLGTVLKLSAFTAGVAALSVFTGAYVAEIIRSGIEAVAKGQTEAAQSLGLTPLQTMRHVILPQALRRVLPPLAGQSINLIKDSSLVSVMALTDLTKAGREIVSSTFSPFEVWFVVALLYLLLTGLLSIGVRRLEQRLAGRGG